MVRGRQVKFYPYKKVGRFVDAEVGGEYILG